MRRRKAFLVVCVVPFLLGISAWQCIQTPPPPGDETASLETRVAACEATSTKGAEDALATITELDAQLAGCEATVAACCEGPPPPPTCPPGEVISCEEAKFCIGEVKTVQGKVVDTHFASSSSGQPTFLNLSCPYPEPCRFTALIWGDQRQEFIGCLGGRPEDVLLGREVCVKGLIELYDDIPEIILKECDQLTVVE